MNKTQICLIGIIMIIFTVTTNQMYQDNVKIRFLENELATKNLHYEWLSEITNSLIYGDGQATKEQLEKIIEFREKHPQPNLD